MALPRTLLAVIGVVVLVALVATVVLRFSVVTVPAAAASATVLRTTMTGPVTPDPSPDVDPATLTPTPASIDCATVSHAEGSLYVCAEAWRDPADGDPAQDYYRLRVHGTVSMDPGSGIRWTAVRATLLGKPSNNVMEAWPDGTFEGACEEMPVNDVGIGFGLSNPAPVATICGLTTGTRNTADWSHRVTWACQGCLLPVTTARGVILYELVAVPEGTIPNWDIGADFGS